VGVEELEVGQGHAGPDGGEEEPVGRGEEAVVSNRVVGVVGIRGSSRGA
jgi:hypothetical protein